MRRLFPLQRREKKVETRSAFHITFPSQNGGNLLDRGGEDNYTTQHHAFGFILWQLGKTPTASKQLHDVTPHRQRLAECSRFMYGLIPRQALVAVMCRPIGAQR